MTTTNIDSKYEFSLTELPTPLFYFNKMELKYPLKYPNPKKDIISVVGIPTIDECRIFSFGGKPVFISNIASSHYGVSSLDDLVDKTALIFRRFKNIDGKYEEPWTWHTYKVTLKSFHRTGRLDMAYAVVENEDGTTENIVIQRICIDWEYKK